MQLRHHFSRAPHINKLAASLIYRARSYISRVNPQPCKLCLIFRFRFIVVISVLIVGNFLGIIFFFFAFLFFFFLCIFTDDNGYWTYLGSLTTPPCNESVTWILFKKCIEVSHHQLNIFRNLRKFSRGEECPCHENHGAVSVYIECTRIS